MRVNFKDGKTMTDFNSVRSYIQTMDIAEQKKVHIEDVADEKHNYSAILNMNKIVSIVTDQYQLLQNTDAFSYATDIMEMAFKDEPISTNIIETPRRAYMTVVLQNKTIKPADGHDIKVGFKFTNGYDKFTSFSGGLFMWREICSNGMVRLISQDSISVKHVGEKDMVGKLSIEFEQLLKKAMPEALKMINSAIKDKVEKYVDYLINIGYSARMIEDIESRLLEWEPSAEQGYSKWQIYDAVTRIWSEKYDARKIDPMVYFYRLNEATQILK
jgi:hypothetical protein